MIVIILALYIITGAIVVYGYLNNQPDIREIKIELIEKE